jgi:hypothetical protein
MSARRHSADGVGLGGAPEGGIVGLFNRQSTCRALAHCCRFGPGPRIDARLPEEGKTWRCTVDIGGGKR